MPSRKQALKPLYLISKRKINALSSAHLQMEYRKHHWKKKIIDCNQQNENRLGSRAFVKYVLHNGIKTIKSIKTYLNLYTTLLKQEYLKKVGWLFLRHFSIVQPNLVHKQDNPFFRHANENQLESICTDLTYESAQIKLFSRLLVKCNFKTVLTPLCVESGSYAKRSRLECNCYIKRAPISVRLCATLISKHSFFEF